MITYGIPSKYDLCLSCHKEPIILVEISHHQYCLCKECVKELHIDLDILEEPNGIDVLLSKEVK